MRKQWYKKSWGIGAIIILILIAVWFIHGKNIKKPIPQTTIETVAPNERTLHVASEYKYIPDRDLTEEPGKESTIKGISMYAEGKYEEAKAFLEHAAKEGNADAKALLGKMYVYGQGVARDTLKGLEYLEDAAERGSDYAKAELGTLYVEGKEGVEKAGDKGLELIHRAIENGKYYGYLAMAKLHAAGEGVEQSSEKAIEYLKQAGEHGYRYAAEEIEKLKEKL